MRLIADFHLRPATARRPPGQAKPRPAAGGLCLIVGRPVSDEAGTPAKGWRGAKDFGDDVSGEPAELGG